jgi:hypothetical protein
MNNDPAPGTTFYFCETCGKRVTDQEVRDKKLKGVYCRSCAAGVMTIEFDALSETEAPAQPDRKRTVTPPHPIQVPIRKPIHAVRTPVRQKTFGLPLAIISGFVVAAAVLIFALSGPSPRTSSSSDRASLQAPPAPIEKNAVQPQPSPRVEAAPAKPISAPVVVAPPAVVAVPPVAIAPAIPTAPAVPAAPDNPIAGDWRTLFDGKTIDGFQTSFGKWCVEDGVIVATSFASNGARLATAAAFDDFEFTCEIRNSGRYVVLQLRGGGTSYKLKPRTDDWETVTVKATGSNVQCNLNGVNIPASDDADDNSGSLRGEIGFYTRPNAVLKIRNIKVRRAQTHQNHDF